MLTFFDTTLTVKQNIVNQYNTITIVNSQLITTNNWVIL